MSAWLGQARAVKLAALRGMDEWGGIFYCNERSVQARPIISQERL
jgi:hypothetical protein